MRSESKFYFSFFFYIISGFNSAVCADAQIESALEHYNPKMAECAPLFHAIATRSIKDVNLLKKSGLIISPIEHEVHRKIADSVRNADADMIQTLFDYKYLHPRYFPTRKLKAIKNLSAQKLVSAQKEIWLQKAQEKIRKAIMRKCTIAGVVKTGAPAGKASKKKPKRNVPNCTICKKDFTLNRIIKISEYSPKKHEHKRRYQCRHGADYFHSACIETWSKKFDTSRFECPVCHAPMKKQRDKA